MKRTKSRRFPLKNIRTQLSSPSDGDNWLALEFVKTWLQKKPEDRDVYGLLLDTAQENPKLHKQIQNLLIEMGKNGSDAAESALKSLTSNLQNILAAAGDVYYAAEYDNAIRLGNTISKDQSIKTNVNYQENSFAKGLPWRAIQYFRRARSYVMARDFSRAMTLLDAAIEEAQARDLSYPEAEETLTSVQDLFTADNLRNDAYKALEQERWEDALDLLKKAITLDPTNSLLKDELNSFQNLYFAESELRKKGIWNVFAPLVHLENLLKKSRNIINIDDSLLNSINKKLRKIKLVRISVIMISLIGIILLILGFR